MSDVNEAHERVVLCRTLTLESRLGMFLAGREQEPFPVDAE